MSRVAAGKGPRLLGVFLVFAAFELVVLGPALELPFVSDDIGYVERNAYVHELSGRNVLAILDPRGEPARNTANYAPLHLLALALEWSLFGNGVLGYHVVNALLHALTATLLAALLCRRGLPLAVGFGAAGLFLLHPANVETTAWISQLKTLLSLALALGALLCEPRRPALALLLFAAALLAKASALFALPVVAAFLWVDAGAAREWRRRSLWLLGWTAVALVYAPIQLAVFQRTAELGRLFDPSLAVHLRTVVAIAGRYLAIAFTGLGVSPFHEPGAALSWLDPWWLLGAAGGVLLAARAAVVLWRRSEEAAWWLWAAAAYLPISQVYRFLYPMADRYLYFVLPGLIGALVFLVRDDLWPRLSVALGPRLARAPTGLTPARASAVAALLLAAFFASSSHVQARVWRSPVHMALAAEARYPQGATAHLLRARRASLRGDPVAAARELRGAAATGYDRFMDIRSDPDFAAVVRHPEVHDVLRDMAAAWIATVRTRSDPSYSELYWLAFAHVLREELGEAVAVYERALAIGGSFDERIRSDLAKVRAHLAVPAAGSEPESDAP